MSLRMRLPEASPSPIVLARGRRMDGLKRTACWEGSGGWAIPAGSGHCSRWSPPRRRPCATPPSAELTAQLGTVGATHVRFLFGFPFALVFLAAVMIALGQALPRPPLVFWPWVVAGALGADRRHRADARGHERPLVRGGLCLYQDRAGAGRAVRTGLPRRRGDAGDGGGDRDRHRRGGGHGTQARHRHGYARDDARARRRRDVRAVGGRLTAAPS